MINHFLIILSFKSLGLVDRFYCCCKSLNRLLMYVCILDLKFKYKMNMLLPKLISLELRFLLKYIYIYKIKDTEEEGSTHIKSIIYNFIVKDYFKNSNL